MSTNLTIALGMARQDRERYLCTLTAPKSLQPGLWALLAFNQEIGAIPVSVSDPMLGTIKLKWWMDALPGVIQGRPPSHPVAQALSVYTQHDDLWLGVLRAMVEARNFELEDGRPASLDALVEYAQDSGGAFHCAMVRMLGLSDPESVSAAHNIGTAWALLGVMRALPYKNGSLRDMLPQGVLVEEVLGVARSFIDASRQAHPDTRALPALLVGRLAERHFKRLRQQNWDPAAQDEPPAGFLSALSVLSGKLTKRY